MTEPWPDVPDLPLDPDGDPEHPTVIGMVRHVLEEHQVDGRHDASDEWVTLTTRAVLTDPCGLAVELGPWSFFPTDARLLAASLAILADVADGLVRP